MKPQRLPYTAPFFDPYSTRAHLYRPGETAHNWRSGIIAGVSWNALEGEAFFFNPDGLVLPLKPNPWTLPNLLRRYSVRREYAAVYGEGLFAMKPARLKAMTSNMRGEWVTYWFIDDATPYANNPQVWAAYVETELQTARQAAEVSSAERLRQAAPRHRRNLSPSGIELPWAPAAATPEQQAEAAAMLSTMVEEAVEDCLQSLRLEYEQQQTADRHLAAWLRGDAGGPPLLTLMQGAA